MKLETQVCSLELSKRLEELGVKQESLYYYMCGNIDFSRGILLRKEDIPGGVWSDEPSAFTVAELGEMLPTALERTSTWLTISRQWKQTDGKGYWVTQYIPDDGEPSASKHGPIFAVTLADSMAKMLIYLLENSLIQP